jgi:hypothetical protein
LDVPTVLFILNALLLAGCAEDVPEDAPIDLSTNAELQEDAATEGHETAEPEGLLQHSPEPCGAVFTPDLALLEETTAAAARWAAATGCDVRVGDNGIPVRLVEMLFDELGNAQPDMWGLQSWTTGGEIIIDVTGLRSESVIPHEMGHALFPRHGHVEDGISLMCSDGGSGQITAADLTFVCEGFPCEAFAPEA